MTSESLNIKLNLDISDITSGVKRVKAQLSGMADKVKQSIPKINTESKRAKESLAQVGDAGDKVKKSMTGIGEEAKKSLSGVVTQSKKVTDALNAMNVASKKNQNTSATGDLADSTGEASVALEELQGTMDDILALNFFGLLGRVGFSDFRSSMRELRKSIRESKKEYDNFFADFLEKNLSSMYHTDDEGNPTSPFSDAEIKAYAKQQSKYNKEVQKSYQGVRDSITEVTKSVGLLIGKVVLLTAALTAVLAVVNAIKVSKLGKELYTNAQQAGFSAQGYQEWAYVLEKAGVEAQELREIMKTLTESQVDVIDGNEDMIKAYAQLGMSVEDVKSMNQEELWNATIKALQNIENTTERTSIAYKIFAEDTSKLTSVLNLSNAQTQQLISTYNQLGGAMSKELIHNSNVLQGSLLNLRVAWEGLKNTLAQYVIPVVIVVVEWLTKAIVAVNTFLKTFFNLDMTPMTEDMSSGMNNVSSSVGGITDAAGEATEAVEKLKRVTMGFDELNIVTDPNAKADSGSGTTGTGTDTGIADLGKLDTSNSIFLEASKQAEELKKKISDWVDEYKVQIATIGAALGALSVAKLIEGLGKALGLGDKFLGVMKNIKGLATSAIVISLQYALVHNYLDKYIKGGDFKDYIKGLFVAALGTALLYATWGTGGLILGLGVTAVASLKAVLDNGGITDVESLTVALTGLASAIGAIAIAVKKIDWAPFIAAFGKIKTALAPVVKAVGSFVSGLSTGAILTIAGIVLAIGSAAYFLYENWEKVTKATKDWIDTNIVPILNEFKDSWDKLKEALRGVGDALKDVIPEPLKKKLVELRDSIGDVIEKMAEWFKSIDWLDGIAKAFEVIGGIIVGILGGAIAGAIQGTIKAWEGLVQAFTGAVEIIGGAIELILRLCKGDLQGVVDAWEGIKQGVIDVVEGLYDATIGVIVEWVKGIINWCKELWDELVGHSIIPDMVEDIIEWFDKLYDDTIGVIVEWAKGITTKLKDMWNGIKSWFNSSVAPKFTKQYWTTKFDTIKQAATEKMNAVKTAFTGAWSTISSWFRSSVAPKFTTSYWSQKFNTIKDGARSAFNGIISIVEKAINGIVSKLNTISWKIPDWVPRYGGSRFGFNLSQVYIPRLATGGIATSSVLANIGENGKEAILPLENNTGWMDALADRIAARNNAPTKIALIVDGKELGWATINNINAITRQTGGLQLAL